MDYIAKKALENKTDEFKDKVMGGLKKKKYGDLKWDEDFNFPPGINVYHFSMGEITAPERAVVSKLYICMLLSTLMIFVNIICESMDWFLGGVNVKFMRLIMGLLNAFIVIPLGVFSFYNGMRSVVINKAAYKYYACSQFVLNIFYGLAAFTNIGSFHGAIYIIMELKHPLIMIVSVVEMAVWFLILLISLYNQKNVRDFNDKNPNY